MPTRKLVRVLHAEPTSEFNVRIEFTDGTRRVVDLEPYLHGPVFDKIRNDHEVFRSLKVNERMGTIMWENGADIDPDVLYHNLTPAWMENDQETIAKRDS
ncbi:MAG: DUF2442 domain-containing protein [Bacteroidota bacterium]